MLNQNQSEWIMNQIKRLLDRNLTVVPRTEEDWKKVIAEAKEIEKKAKHNPDCRSLILEAIGFLENVGKLNVLSQETEQEKP